VKRLLLVAVLIPGLSVSSASADPAAITAVKFKAYTFGYVRDGFLGAARPRNRILVGRTRAQALRWDKWIWPRGTTAPQSADFASQTLVGVFLVDRPAAVFAPDDFFPMPQPPDVSGVAVTSLAISSGTLLLTLAVSPYPPELRGPGVESPIEYWGLPWAPSARYHAFTVVTVAKAAVAQVRRVIVTQEVYETSDPLVVDVPALPGGG
jgi:hypothetical protein